MTVPRVLLLTGTPPGYAGVGGIFLRDLCLSYPRESICCFALTSLNCRSVARDLDWLPIACAPLLRQSGFGRLGPHFAHLSGLLVRPYARLVQAPALAARVAQFGRQQGVDMVWAVLNRPSIIEITRRVTSALGARLVTTIWDAPEFVAMHRGFDQFSLRTLLGEFEKVLRMSVRCGVASEGMGEEYKKRYGIEPLVLIHGAHPDLRRPPAKELTSEKQFTIGFAGSFYARNEWQALLSALSKVNWQIEGREVIVRVLGERVSFQGDGKMHIEYLGWRSVEETVELMSQVDVTYLPYWFDDSHSLFVRLSFPNKLTTYLAAGRPVLFHGPLDSSPTRFLAQYPAGVCCHSLEKDAILDTLKRLITDQENYARMTKAGQDALDQELSRQVFLHRFAELIGIKDSQLVEMDR